jgi:RNA polymerase sigma factor (sigma-70 family)
MSNPARKAFTPESPAESSAPHKLSTAEQRRANDDAFTEAYQELRRLARGVRRFEDHATINTTALVHEAWMKLKDAPQLAEKAKKEEAHFKAIAARAMRQVLVEEARRRSAHKRGGESKIVSLDDSPEQESVTLGIFAGPGVPLDPSEIVECGDQLLKLDALLEELSSISPRQAQIFESRFFAGMSVPETAAALDLSESSVERDYRAAKAWLASKLRPGNVIPATARPAKKE